MSSIASHFATHLYSIPPKSDKCTYLGSQKVTNVLYLGPGATNGFPFLSTKLLAPKRPGRRLSAVARIESGLSYSPPASTRAVSRQATDAPSLSFFATVICNILVHPVKLSLYLFSLRRLFAHALVIWCLFAVGQHLEQDTNLALFSAPEFAHPHRTACLVLYQVLYLPSLSGPRTPPRKVTASCLRP